MSKARHSRGVGLLLFDLDDTIVQSGTYVSPRVIAALNAAHDAGFVLAIASGRPRCMLDATILRTGVMDYCVCANGATVHRLDDGSLVAARPMSREEALDCHATGSRFEASWNAFVEEDAYFELKGMSYLFTGRTGALARGRRNERGARKRPLVVRVLSFAQRGLRYVWRMVSNRSQHQVRSVRRILEGASDGVHKMGCVFPNAVSCEDCERALRSDGRFEVARMGAVELEITARGTTKGTGAKLLLDHLGIDAKDSVAFGDGGNDLPLADAVGRFVAMGNAEESVKQAADEVCASVSEDGVAQWIECMLEQRHMVGDDASRRADNETKVGA